jgi:hypothetical protein
MKHSILLKKVYFKLLNFFSGPWSLGTLSAIA